MKILIVLLLSFNVLAEYKIDISSAPNSDGGQTGLFTTEQDAKDRLIKIAELKNGWRKGEFTLIETDSLFSKVFTECDEFEVCTDTTKYYHPTNWNYSITDVTVEEQAKKNKKNQEDASIESIRAKLSDGSAKLGDIIEYLKIKEGL